MKLYIFTTAILLSAVTAHADEAKTIRCKSNSAELIFSSSDADPVGISFKLGNASKAMNAMETHPRFALYRNLIIFTEDRSGIQFEANYGMDGKTNPPIFTLSVPFGSDPGSYATIENGKCEVL